MILAGSFLMTYKNNTIASNVLSSLGFITRLQIAKYCIYSLIRRTIFYEKICLFDENLLKTRGASYNRVFSRNEI